MRSDFSLWRLLADPRGRVGRATFLLTGFVLVLLKVALDFTLARFDAESWRLQNYLWSPSPLSRLTSGRHFVFEATMLSLAAPFVWIGVCLCAKRLRAAALPVGLVVLFFVPILKWILFALLITLPNREPAHPVPDVVRPVGWEKVLPISPFGSAAAAVGLTVLVTSLLVLISVRLTPSYGGTLFIGIPFFAGMLTTVLYEVRRPRTFNECVWPTFLSLLLTGVLLIAVATEGIVCLVMAAPLAFCEAFAGSLVAHLIMKHRHQAKSAVLPALAVLPLLFAMEKVHPPPAPLHSVVSEVRINAPIERVWQNVIGFTEIPPPREWIFRAGIAYPERARIDGKGAGAIRHCVFSTGEFVEPITTWDEPRRLAFDVSAQPDPLKELSPYGSLQTPHLRGHFQTEHGEFQLVNLGETTLLRGTTWYRLNYAPQAYWSQWSDYLIHQIHRRVLEHIRMCSEAAAVPAH